MSFVGLVPSESSSGESRHIGGITKTGNRHVRRLLIEAAWHYVGAPAVVSQRLVDRRQGVAEEVVSIADRALRRLRTKSLKLAARKKSSTKIATALARELAGFVWAAAKATPGLPAGSKTEEVAKAKPITKKRKQAKRPRLAAVER
jgi:hypothetical protein